MKNSKTESSALRFKALGNPSRLDILACLAEGERCVCDIYEHLRLPQNLVSHHLALLKKNGFITAKKEGKWVYYSLNQSGLSEISDFICKLSSVKPLNPKPKCRI